MPKITKQVQSYKVCIAKTDKKGAFSCPSCGAIISPNDLSEKTYSILEVKMSDAGLAEITICCRSCGSEIHLTGFSIDPKLHEINGEITFISHV